MSVDAEAYLIVGLNVKPYLTEKFEDWKWTDDGEKFTDYCNEDNVQFIIDGMCGNYTYFGYIIGKIEEMYGNYSKEIDCNYALIPEKVNDNLIYLVHQGILKEEVLHQQLKMILFNHCS